jgi:hypothetical protein
MPAPYARHAIRAPSSWWPGKPTAAQHVGVRMANGLPSLGAGVENDAVPAVANTFGQRDLMCLGHHLSQQAVVSQRERRQIRIVIFRYHKHVRWRLRAYVTESN